MAHFWAICQSEASAVFSEWHSSVSSLQPFVISLCTQKQGGGCSCYVLLNDFVCFCHNGTKCCLLHGAISSSLSLKHKHISRPPVNKTLNCKYAYTVKYKKPEASTSDKLMKDRNTTTKTHFLQKSAQWTNPLALVAVNFASRPKTSLFSNPLYKHPCFSLKVLY